MTFTVMTLYLPPSPVSIMPVSIIPVSIIPVSMKPVSIVPVSIMHVSKMPVFIMAVSIMPYFIMSVSIMPFSIMPVSPSKTAYTRMQSLEAKPYSNCLVIFILDNRKNVSYTFFSTLFVKTSYNSYELSYHIVPNMLQKLLTVQYSFYLHFFLFPKFLVIR